MLVSIQFGESTKLSASGIDYHTVIFYKFGNTEERPKFLTNMNNLISMYEHFQMNSAPPKVYRKIQRNKHIFNSSLEASLRFSPP